LAAASPSNQYYLCHEGVVEKPPAWPGDSRKKTGRQAGLEPGGFFPHYMRQFELKLMSVMQWISHLLYYP